MYWAVLGCTGLWWAVLGCTGLYWAVLGSTGMYWTVLGFTRLNWAVVGCSRLYCGVMGCTGRSQQLISVYSAIFGMVTNNQPNKQPGDPRASLLLTSVRRQSFAKFLWTFHICLSMYKMFHLRMELVGCHRLANFGDGRSRKELLGNGACPFFPFQEI